MIFVVTFSGLMINAVNAQIPVTDVANLSANQGSWLEGILTTANTTASSLSEYYLEYKESVLDGLAWAIAKQVLQSLTADIVSWINSGFEGEPAFLTDPESFFMDVGDQITGEFLSRMGPLTELCSPFSLDIRLSLALNMSNRGKRSRYTCTLSKVIDSFNKSSVSINGKRVTGKDIASGSVDGFTDGDFFQGGWPAFIALTTEPQNNVYGAFLIADSDLRTAIATHQATVRADLSLGNGFRSWEKCTDALTVDPNDPSETEEIDYGKSLSGKPGIKSVTNANGTITYKSCKTETPGSVISSSLNKQLGAPTDQLNIADEFDEIIGALFSQLVQQVLSGGLASAGSKSHSNPDSLVNQLQKESGGALEKYRKKILAEIEKKAPDALEYSTLRQEGLAVLEAEKNIYTTALACFMAKPEAGTDPTIISYITRINETLNKTVNPDIDTYKAKNIEAGQVADTIQRIKDTVNSATSTLTLQAASSDFSDLIHSKTVITPIDLRDARVDLDNAKNIATAWHQDAMIYQLACPPTTTP